MTMCLVEFFEECQELGMEHEEIENLLSRLCEEAEAEAELRYEDMEE